MFTKLPVLQWLKNGASICEQRQFDAPWSGGQARQGREPQPSVAAPNIWMTLYLEDSFSSLKITLATYHRGTIYSFSYLMTHVLHLKSEPVVIRRRMNMVWMINDGHMITEDECGLNILTCVLQLRKIPGKTSSRKTDPTGDRTRARWVRGSDVTPRPQRWSRAFRKQNNVTECFFITVERRGQEWWSRE